MSLNSIIQPYIDDGYYVEQNGKTHHGVWTVLFKKKEYLLSSRYDAIFIYYVDGDVSSKTEDDFISTLETIWSQLKFDYEDQALFLYRGRCNISSLNEKITQNYSYPFRNNVKINLIEKQEKDIRPSFEPQISNKVFVVHGHDKDMRESVARTLEKLELDPVILAERPNQGMTIIEKIEKYSDVCYAIVLVSPDDVAYSRKDQNDIKLRARQNVILELGWFMARLGRRNVALLYRKKGEFDWPSDMGGVLYIAYDSSDSWKIKLARELQSCGLQIDLNKLIY